MFLPISGLQVSGIIENDFTYFSTKTYVVGTQKNHLIDTQNILFKLIG